MAGLDHLSAEDLFLKMSRTAVKDRSGLMVELISRASAPPDQVQLLSTCGKPNRGRTESGAEKKGLTRCGSTSCFWCQVRAGKQAATRSWSLVLAGSDGIPIRKLISSVTINAEDRNLPRFKKQVRNFMLRYRLKWTGEYSISLAGLLHVHVTVLHPEMSGLTLRGLLQDQFGSYPRINVKGLSLTKTIEDAVRGWIQYAHVPFKNKDLIRHPTLRTPEGIAQFIEWDSAVLGDRRCEGGFTLEQKASAGSMRKQWTKNRRSGYGPTPAQNAIVEKMRISKQNKLQRIMQQLEPRDAVEGSIQLGSGPGSVCIEVGITQVESDAAILPPPRTPTRPVQQPQGGPCYAGPDDPRWPPMRS
jgi:hypothetical protein